MANWEAVAGGPLFGQVLAPLESLVDTLQDIIAPIQTILSIIQSILKVVRAFLLDTTSILLAVIQTIVDQVTQFLNQLANAGLYILTVAPNISSESAMVESVKGGFDGFVNKVYNSFFDQADPQRPVFAADQPCAGVVLAASSGNLLGVLSLLSLISKSFSALFRSTYKAPVISGFSGDGTNVIRFQKPNLPSDMWTSLRYELQRATVQGGKPLTVQAPASNAQPVNTNTQEYQRDPNTGRIVRQYETIAKFGAGISLFDAAQYILVDGPDTETPHLVRFNLSNQANVVNNASSVGRAVGTTQSLGPSRLTLLASSIPKFPLSTVNISTLKEIQGALANGSDITTKYGDVFNGYLIDGGTSVYYLDVRVNGASIGTAKNPLGNIYVKTFDGSNIQLSESIPLGSKVEVFTYIQVKAADLIKIQDFNTGNPIGLVNSNIGSVPSIYTATINATGSAPINGTTYFYRVVVLSTDETTGPTSTPPQNQLNQAYSNEIKLTPTLGFAPQPVHAYCMGKKAGPFVITGDTSLIDFSTSKKRYKINLRPSKINQFSRNDLDYGDAYGLTLPSKYSGQVTSSSSLTTNALNQLNTSQGLLFEYTSFNGQKVTVFPGDYIPVDVQDILLDLRTQCPDRSIRFSAKNGHIVIQEHGSNAKRNSQIYFNSANTALGFDAGLCMATTASQPPDWERYAFKDFFPQIFDIINLINQVAQGLISSIESSVKAMVDFIDLLSLKIKVLQDFLTNVQNFLNLIKSLKIELPNLYLLKVDGLNGSTNLANAIKNATGKPLSSPDDFACGLAIVVGGADAALITPLLFAIL